MTIRIRPETPADYRETENLVREAFWNVYAPGASEHYLLHVMRDAENFVPELDFVAEENGRIVGQVVFMKARIECDDGCCREVLSLGPIAVEPPLQKRGIGRALIEHGAAAAAKLGYQAVLLCGDPRVYAKLGFEPAEKYGIRTSENNYFAALHVRPLNGNLLADYAGRYFEDAIYNVEEGAVMAFDAAFPAKEKCTDTPTQRRLIEVRAMLRPFEKGDKS